MFKKDLTNLYGADETTLKQRKILPDCWKFGEERKRPVFHVQHLSLSSSSPLRADHPGNAIKDDVKPRKGELLFQKHVNSAFIGTDLEGQLRENWL